MTCQHLNISLFSVCECSRTYC